LKRKREHAEGAITSRKRYPLTLRGERIILGERTWVMGVLNVTPDSFSDGGRFDAPGVAVAHGLAMVEAGADIVDVGGESTRPSAAAVDVAEERRRVVPVIEALRRDGRGRISIDTSKSDVAQAALDAGADLVNDVSGFSFDPEMAKVVARAGAPAVVMHLRGGFGSMHHEPRYDDVMGEVADELEEALQRGLEAGVSRDRMIVDPGIGFSKAAGHSLDVLRRLPELARLDRPVLVGPSRKSFMAKIVRLPRRPNESGVAHLAGSLRDPGAAADRLMGTAGAVAACVLAGAHLVRVHDVSEMMDVVRVCDAIRGSES
jgi:dihydropteroate synthase